MGLNVIQFYCGMYILQEWTTLVMKVFHSSQCELNMVDA